MRQRSRGFEPEAGNATRSAREEIGPPADCGMDMWFPLAAMSCAWVVGFDRQPSVGPGELQAGGMPPVAEDGLPYGNGRKSRRIGPHDAGAQAHGDRLFQLSDRRSFLG